MTTTIAGRSLVRQLVGNPPDEAVSIGRDMRSDADPWLFAGIFLLTAVGGIADVAAYLGLGQFFSGNMTGNALFLGFASVGVLELSFTSILLALGAFVAGSGLRSGLSRAVQ